LLPQFRTQLGYIVRATCCGRRKVPRAKGLSYFLYVYVFFQQTMLLLYDIKDTYKFSLLYHCVRNTQVSTIE